MKPRGGEGQNGRLRCPMGFLVSAEKRKFTETLNVGINSSTTENAYTGTTKYLLLCLDRKYKQ